LFIPDPGSRIRILTFYPSRIPDPGSRGQKGSKRHRIPDPGSGSATLPKTEEKKFQLKKIKIPAEKK
jgi:hypothetical protein